MDAISAPDRARFERHLTRCEDCAREIAGLREATARLAAAAAVPPPPALKARVMAAAAATRQRPPVPEPEAASRTWPLRTWPLRTWQGRPAPKKRLAMAAGALAAAAAVAAAVVFGVSNGGMRDQLSRAQASSQQVAAVLTARDATMMTGAVRGGGTVTSGGGVRLPPRMRSTSKARDTFDVNREDPQRRFTQPRWNGEDLRGRAILIHAEQGMGDVIQMMRYAPLVAARGGKIILECHAPLKRLLAQMPDAMEVVARGQTLPAFDVHLPIMSLPGIFHTTPQTVPLNIPYIRPDAAEAGAWRQRIDPLGLGRKVGLVWAGQPIPPGRSIPANELAPLAQASGVRLISLQIGGAERPNLPSMIDWTDQLTDFADTAALMANLDLLITIDTAAAHLAGAMGKPAWVLLSHEPDWRWTLSGESSRWYATARLFRQPSLGDWDSVIDRLRGELERFFSAD